MSDAMRQLYDRKMVACYAAKSLSIRWCPNNNCEYGIEKGSVKNTTGVTCRCGREFCIDCGLDNHEPCSCEMALEWRNFGEQKISEILNTRPCPKCGKMTIKSTSIIINICPSCNYTFCWNCNNPDPKHSEEKCDIQVIITVHSYHYNRTFMKP